MVGEFLSCWTPALGGNHMTCCLSSLSLITYPPWKWAGPQKGNFFLQPSIFRAYVSFGECTPRWIFGWVRILVKSGGLTIGGICRWFISTFVGIMFLVVEIHTSIYIYIWYVWIGILIGQNDSLWVGASRRMVCINEIIPWLNISTPRKIDMEPKNHPIEKEKSSSKPSFSGSMLIFLGVTTFCNGALFSSKDVL